MRQTPQPLAAPAAFGDDDFDQAPRQQQTRQRGPRQAGPTTTNPLTGRSIRIGGDLYNRLVREGVISQAQAGGGHEPGHWECGNIGQKGGARDYNSMTEEERTVYQILNRIESRHDPNNPDDPVLKSLIQHLGEQDPTVVRSFLADEFNWTDWSPELDSQVRAGLGGQRGGQHKLLSRVGRKF